MPPASSRRAAGCRSFPAAPTILRACCARKRAAAQLERDGTVEVISDLERDGRQVHGDLRQGVYVTFRAPTDYAAACFAQYGLTADPSGKVAALWRPVPSDRPRARHQHRVGGVARRADRLADRLSRRGGRDRQARSRAGEILDGEGGETVWGRLLPAAVARADDRLPIGLAHGVRLRRRITAGAWSQLADVDLDETDPVVQLRRAMSPTEHMTAVLLSRPATFVRDPDGSVADEA